MCLDRLFNLQVPASTERVVVIRPSGKTFVSGLASAFDEDFDADLLKGFMTMLEFTKMVEAINDELANIFPCLFCWIIGYVLCPFTLGLSLLCPRECINDAEEALERRLKRLNRGTLGSKGIEIALVKAWSTSWLEIRLPEKPISDI